MPRVSVVVPVFNVERYVAECLDSALAQSFTDLEIVVVDDGSTDGGPAIAEHYAERDGRIRVLRQDNHGLGHARNTGVAAATGDFLMFLDSDDRLPHDAVARLHGMLERTGSDFATGNVHRFNRTRTWPAAFLRRTFMRHRARTHVGRFRWLIADRMAQNKLWRRSFWDQHALRFPEGCLHEDISVVVPAHFMARSVDVIRQPVYLYREREDGDLSITQRRAELRTLRDRIAAIEATRRFLCSRGPAGSRRVYDESVVEDDLRYHLDVLDEADEDYRAEFFAYARDFLTRAGADVESRLPAIQRLKWHLVRRGHTDELLEVLRFQKTHPRPRTPLDTTRRRARHMVTLLRPAHVPAEPREPRPRTQRAFVLREI
jgi:CDP-glycerol glycerophosphotransferase